MLVAASYHPKCVRSIEDFLKLTDSEQDMWHEWLVSQELLRRSAIRGEEILHPLAFWQDKNHEIDFVLPPQQLLEVKRGSSSILEFNWFNKQFPHQQLTVVNKKTFASDYVQGITLEDFLLQE